MNCTLTNFIARVRVVFLFAFAMCAAVSAEARSIESVSRRVTEGKMFLDVTFEAGSEGDNHALYIAYDMEDKGDDIGDWDALQRGCVVAAGATSATIPVSPLLTEKGYTFCRVFLTTSAAPYDTLIEFLRQTGTQYIDTGIYPDPTTVAVMDVEMLNTTKTQQRFFAVSADNESAVFAFDVYINGRTPKNIASACQDGKGDFEPSGMKPTADRLLISLSAVEKHHLFITNLVSGATAEKYHNTECTATSAATLFVFAQHHVNGTTLSTKEIAQGAKLYGFSITNIVENKAKCVCDYKPCMLGGRAGVYDSVTDTVINSPNGEDFDAANSGSPIACSLLGGETQVAVAQSATELLSDYVWGGTSPNWGDADAWTKDGKSVTWADGNNAVFGTLGATAALAANVMAKSLVFSKDATLSGPATLTVPTVQVNPGVTATISAPTAGALEKTGAGMLTLAANRTDATTVTEGTLKMDGATVAGLTLGTVGGAPVAFDYGGQELVKNPQDYLVTGSTVTLTNGVFSASEMLQIRDSTAIPAVLTIAKDASLVQGSSGTRRLNLQKDNGTAIINVAGGTLGSASAGVADSFLQHAADNGCLHVNVTDGGRWIYSYSVYAMCYGSKGKSPSLYMTINDSMLYVGESFHYGHDKVTSTNPTGVLAATNSIVYIGNEFIIGRGGKYDLTEGGYTADFDNCVVTAKTFAVYYDRQLSNARFNGSRFVFKAAGGSIAASDDESNWFTIGDDGLIIDTQGYSATLNANLGGSGAVTKVGAGTLTVSRNQATTGGFNVSAGALALNPGLTFAGPVSVADGAKLDINAANTVNVGSLAFAEGSSLNIASYIGTTPLAVSTDVTLPESGTVNLTLDGGAFGEGVYAIYSNSKVTEEEGAKFSFSAADNLVGEWSVADNILILTVGEIDPNAWTGRGGDGKMSNGANWGGGIVPVAGSDIDFSGLSVDTTIIADAGRKFGAVTMGAGVITFSGDFSATSFTDMSKIAVAADSAVTIDSDIIITESSQRLCSNIAAGGKLRIAGVLEVEQPSGNFKFSANNAAGAVVVEGGIVMNTGSTSSGVLMNVKSLAIGENGISFKNNSPFRLINKPVLYALGERTMLGSNGTGLFRGNSAPFTFCTTQFESDEPATITLDTKVTGVEDYWAQWAVTGCGRFETTAATGTNRGWTIDTGATFSLNPSFDTSTQTSGQNYKVNSGATLEVAASGTLGINGNSFTLADGAALGFSFTERRTAPVLALGSKYVPALTIGGAIQVKISGDVWPVGGEHVLTTCGGFNADGVTVSLASGAPKWVKGVRVNEEGNIVLAVKPKATMIIVR